MTKNGETVKLQKATGSTEHVIYNDRTIGHIDVHENRNNLELGGIYLDDRDNYHRDVSVSRGLGQAIMHHLVERAAKANKKEVVIDRTANYGLVRMVREKICPHATVLFSYISESYETPIASQYNYYEQSNTYHAYRALGKYSKSIELLWIAGGMVIQLFHPTSYRAEFFVKNNFKLECSYGSSSIRSEIEKDGRILVERKIKDKWVPSMNAQIYLPRISMKVLIPVE